MKSMKEELREVKFFLGVVLLILSPFWITLLCYIFMSPYYWKCYFNTFCCFSLFVVPFIFAGAAGGAGY